MPHPLTRRQVLAAGAVSSGLLMSSGCAQTPEKTVKQETPQKAFWNPGPDKNLVRDLTPGSTPVRLAGYLAYPEKGSITEAVKQLRASGHAGAIASVDPWYSAKDSEIKELKSALKEYDVVIFEVGGYRNMLHPDESIRQEYLKHLARCIETADKVGCQMVGTITGSRSPIGVEFVDNYNVHPDNWTQETWDFTIKSIKQILNDTAGMKAALGMEAQVTTNLDGPKAHRRLMDEIGSERVKTNLDPTNMIHLYNYYHTTELINECFDLLGEDIFGCHAKDTYIFPHTQTVHVQEVCPGRGVLDYETYLVRLSRMKWPRSLLPEHIPGDQFAEAEAYIRKVAEKVGVTILG
ncbi:sugar phosphate isomerase/epimerase [bacterium]|nr:sugar phosphate isomerase/epimerase [bacterium]